MTGSKSLPFRDRYNPEVCSMSLPFDFVQRFNPDVISVVGRAVSEPITRPQIRPVWRRLWTALSPELLWGQEDEDDVELA